MERHLCRIRLRFPNVARLQPITRKIIRSRNVVFNEGWKTERFTPSDIEEAYEDP